MAAVALVAVPDVVGWPGPVRRVLCARGGCANRVEELQVGRPRKYCGDTCRKAAYRARRRSRGDEAAAQRQTEWVVRLFGEVLTTVLVKVLTSAGVGDPAVVAGAVSAAAAGVAAATAGRNVADVQPTPSEPNRTPRRAAPAATPDVPQPRQQQDVAGPVDGWAMSVCGPDATDRLVAVTAAAWRWAVSDDCPVRWWSDLGRLPTRMELVQLRREFAAPELAAWIDVAIVGVHDVLRGAAGETMKAKRVTHKDRGSMFAALRTEGFEDPADVVAAFKWAAAERFWASKLTASGIPVFPKTRNTLLSQWVANGRPGRGGVEQELAAGRLMQVWAGLVLEPGVPPLPGWRNAAAAALSGTANLPPMTEAVAAEAMRWMMKAEHRQFYGDSSFPTPLILGKVKARMTGASNSRGPSPDRAAYATSESLAAAANDGIYARRPRAGGPSVPGGAG